MQILIEKIENGFLLTKRPIDGAPHTFAHHHVLPILQEVFVEFGPHDWTFPAYMAEAFGLEDRKEQTPTEDASHAVP